jgi:hypothetical protein
MGQGRRSLSKGVAPGGKVRVHGGYRVAREPPAVAAAGTSGPSPMMPVLLRAGPMIMPVHRPRLIPGAHGEASPGCRPGDPSSGSSKRMVRAPSPGNAGGLAATCWRRSWSSPRSSRSWVSIRCRRHAAADDAAHGRVDPRTGAVAGGELQRIRCSGRRDRRRRLGRSAAPAPGIMRARPGSVDVLSLEWRPPERE